jgi:radical SAM superfamily enzyme YgiQ (UPF0313 family)
LKTIYKDVNFSGDALVAQLQKFRDHDIHVLASFIFGLPTDTPSTFRTTAELAHAAQVSFAQFVLLTPFRGRSISRSGKTAKKPSRRSTACP